MRMRMLRTLLAAAVAGAAILVAATPAPGNQWDPSSMLVLRSNDAILSESSSQPVFIDEVDPTGALLSSFGPLVGEGPDSRQIALSQQYPRDGLVQLSGDGTALTFMAMDVPWNTQWPNTAVSNSKVAVIVFANGTVDSQTFSVSMYEAGNYYLFTAATQDGSGFYTAGPSATSCDAFAGVRYLPAGTSGVNVLVSPPSLGACNYNTRYCGVYGGQLYASFADAGARGVYQLGTGLPTASSPATLLPGFSNYQGTGDLGAVSGNTFSTVSGFVFESPGSLYLADNGQTNSWHVWHMANPAPSGGGGSWSNDYRWRWATLDQGYSLAGRAESIPGVAGGSFVVYSVTFNTAAASLGTLWRYVVATSTGNAAPFAANAAPNTKWRSVAPPPYAVYTVASPSPPAVNITAMFIAENSAPGTVLSPALGASLPRTPEVTWVILSGANNATGNGLVNVAAFQIASCSGEISVVNNVLDYETASVYVLSVMAYYDPSVLSLPGGGRLQTVVNVTIQILNVNEPPILAAPFALNATVVENSPPGTALGLLRYWDPEGEPPTNFTWAVVSPDPSGGLFAFTPGGVLVVSALAGQPGHLLDFELVNNYTLSVSMTDRSLATSIGTGRVNVTVLDADDPPVIAPAGQLVSFVEVPATGAPGVGAVSGGGITVTDEDRGRFASPPRFTQVWPVAAAAAACGARPLGADSPVDATGVAPLFSVNATNGSLAFASLPPASTLPWSTRTSFAYGGVIVRAAWAVCVNVSDTWGAWSAAYVSAAVVSADSSRPLITGFAVVGQNNNTLVAADGVTPVMDTNGGGTVFFSGSSFGPANATVAVANFTAVYASSASALGLRYSVPCRVVVAGTLLACAHAPGVGAGLKWTVLFQGSPVLSSLPLVISYVAPSVLALAGATSLPTQGGVTVTLSGSNFGPAGSSLASAVSVRFGPTGTEYACTYASNTQAQLRCVTGAAAGALLPFTVSIGGQLATFPPLLLPNGTAPGVNFTFNCAPPVVRGISPGLPSVSLIGLNTLGGEPVQINGTNFGPIGTPLLVEFVSGRGAGARLPLSSCSVLAVAAVGAPSSLLSCLTPAGIGSNLSVSVTAAGVAPFSLTPGLLVAYLPPSFAALGAVLMPAGDSSTQGGATFLLNGRGFGPIAYSGGTAVDVVLYGHNASQLAATATAALVAAAAVLASGDDDAGGGASAAAIALAAPGVYVASDCRITTLDAVISCLTTAGVGRDHAVLLSVGGQVTIAAPAASALSYAPPFLAAFSGPGAALASTLGGQAVALSGENFGPADAYSSSRLQVSYSVVSGGVTFAVAPLSCNVSTPHTGITCTLAPAGGASLSWSVVLDGQGSASPSTSYAPPVIAAITQADFTSPLTAANASGGDTVLLLGSGFGPAAFDGTNASLLTSVTYGPSGYEYVAASATVDNDGLLAMTLAPGTGAALIVRVTIAGQSNAIRPGGPTLSYAAPALLAMVPSTAPTSFAAVLGLTNTQFATLVTTGLPLLDPSVRIAVQLGAHTLTPVLPADPLAAQNPDGSINISVPLPAEGAGLGLPVSVLCTRGGSVVSTSGGNTSFFSYAGPVITGVAVTRLAFNSSASGAAACPFPAGGATWQCGSTALLLVSITGINFGANDAAPGYQPDGVARGLQLSFISDPAANTSAWAVVSGPGPATTFSDSSLTSSPVLWRWSWSHTLVQLITTVPAASVAITLTSPPPSNGVQSAGSAYTRISPSITGLRGKTSGLPSAGGNASSPLILSVVSISAPYYASVLLGGGSAPCPLLVMQAGACGSTLVSDFVAGSGTSLPDGINAAVFGPGSQAPGMSPGTFTLCCVPPPGQGAPISVQVHLFASAGDANPTTSDASSALATISYATPSLQTVTVFSATLDGSGVLCDPVACANNSTVTATPYSPGGTVIVPTAPTILRLSGANLGTAPLLFAGDTAVAGGSGGAPGTPCPAPAAPYTCYDFPSPPGEGSGRAYYASLGAFPLSLSAGGQSSSVWGMHYAPPVAAVVLPLNDGSAPPAETSSDDDGGVAPGSALGSFPTRGGVRVVVIGANFGAPNPLRTSAAPRVSLISLPAPLSASQTATVYTMTGCARLNQTAMACTLPFGAGTGLLVSLTVADQTGLSAGPIFNYTAPNIQAVALNSSLPYDSTSLNVTGGPEPLLGSGLPLLSGPTTGGSIVVLTGTNFGRPPNSAWAANASVMAAPPSPGFCVFFSWTYRSPSSPVPLCNGLEDFVGEGEYPWGSILAWDHEMIMLRVGPGAGTKDILVAARGGASTAAAAGPSFHFRYAAPVVLSVSPSSGGSTDGGDSITITGLNFGPAPRNTTLPPYSTAPSSASLALPLSDAPGLPTALLRIRVGTQCLSATFDGAGGRSSGLAQAAALCTAGGSAVLSQDHTRLVFQLPPGSGANLSVTLELVDLLQVSAPAASPPLYFTAAPTLFSYAAPFITSYSPSTVTLFGSNVTVLIRGMDFGAAPSNSSGGGGDGDLAVVIGDQPCLAPQRSAQPGYGTAVSCGVPASAAAGPRAVAVTVAGQTGYASASPSRLSDGTDYSPLLIVCGAGYFGRIGEPCLPCAPSIPARAAFCAGFNANATPAAVTPGLLANPANAPYSYPVALPGFYSLSVTCVATYNGDGSLANPCAVTNTSAACPSAVRALFPSRDTCIVGCSPASSCLGANVCAPGYVSSAPFYACKACAPNYFRTSNACTACPASPIAQLVGLLVLLLAVGAVMYSLSRMDVYLGFVSIGLDFLQTIAILATTKTVWSPAVTSLLTVLSAFNLDIDLVAPECLVAGTSFQDKYAAVLLLPLVLCGFAVLLHGANLGFKWLAQGRTKNLNRNLPFLVSFLLALLSLLYLYVTRTLLEMFNCAPLDPPDGYTYLQAAPIPCGISGGTQLTLLPWSVIGIIVYTVGYPAFLLAHWWRRRELIMEDQLLRAKGVGDDRLTNPHAYALRKAFGRTYFSLRPDATFWGVVVLGRKALLAAAIVAFNLNAVFQLAACLLVLLCAYALQVRCLPFMPPTAYDAVLAEHTQLSFSSALHARLRAALASVESRGRKRTRRNLMEPGQALRVADIVATAREWAFDYNTAEAALLFAAILVILLGMLIDVAATSGDYTGSQDVVSDLLIAVVSVALLYLAAIVVGEAWVLLSARQAAAAHQAMMRSKSGRKLAGDDATARAGAADRSGSAGSASQRTLSAMMSFRGDKAASSAAALHSQRSAGSLAAARAAAGARLGGEPTEQGLNPLFASAGGGGSAVKAAPLPTDLGTAHRLEMLQLRDSLSLIHGEPSAMLWNRVKDSFIVTASALDDALTELAAMKAEAGHRALNAESNSSASVFDTVATGARRTGGLRATMSPTGLLGSHTLASGGTGQRGPASSPSGSVLRRANSSLSSLRGRV